MLQKQLILICLGVILTGKGNAQVKGILPFSGGRFFYEGISVKTIEVKTDGAFLLNNRMPLNKELEVRFLLPAGFSEDKAKNIFAAAELNILSQTGSLLYQVPNLLKQTETSGIPPGKTRDISLKIPLKPEIIKAEPGCTIKLRLYDLRSKNQLKLELPISIARPGEALMLSKINNEVKTTAPALAYSSGVKMKDILFSVDTTIRVNPKMAYMSMEMTSIQGSSITEMLSGKESYWVYDNDLNELKLADKQLKQVGGAMESNEVDYLSKIPFRLKTTTGKNYFVRFRWESTDRKKVIDIVVKQ